MPWFILVLKFRKYTEINNNRWIILLERKDLGLGPLTSINATIAKGILMENSVQWSVGLIEKCISVIFDRKWNFDETFTKEVLFFKELSG